MAKQGMKHDYTEHRKNDTMSVPQISGKAKSGKKKACPRIAGVPGADGKVYHSTPHKPTLLSVIDNELAVENMENNWDMTMADLQDFGGQKT